MFGFRKNKPQALLNVVRFLAPLVVSDDTYNFSSESTIDFRGDPEVLTWILRQSNYLEQRPSKEECSSLALKLSSQAFQPNFASVIRTVLGEWRVDPVISSLKDAGDNTLLHCAAWNLGERCAMYFKKYQEIWDSTSSQSHPNVPNFCAQVIVHDPELSVLLELIQDLMKESKDLHQMNTVKCTPLLFVFFGYMLFSDTGFGYFYEWPQERNAPVNGVHLAARLWLSQLQNSGCSLKTYGKCERRIHAKGHALYFESTLTNKYAFLEWKKVGDDAKEISRSEQRLISFTYGEEVIDWRFWFVEVMEDEFVEFWEMVEQPERAIPGAWEEEEVEHVRYYADAMALARD